MASSGARPVHLIGDRHRRMRRSAGPRSGPRPHSRSVLEWTRWDLDGAVWWRAAFRHGLADCRHRAPAPTSLDPGAGAAVLAAVAVLASSGCGGSAGDGRLASGPFRLVGHEDVYLNGVENDDRPPISFLLVGSDASAPPVSEAELLAAYVESMREDGWRVDPYDTDEDWWRFYGGRGFESVRIGPASEFAALATADEGYSRPKFRQVISELGEPLVVVSIDPQD